MVKEVYFLHDGTIPTRNPCFASASSRVEKFSKLAASIVSPGTHSLKNKVESRANIPRHPFKSFYSNLQGAHRPLLPTPIPTRVKFPGALDVVNPRAAGRRTVPSAALSDLRFSSGSRAGSILLLKHTLAVSRGDRGRC